MSAPRAAVLGLLVLVAGCSTTPTPIVFSYESTRTADQIADGASPVALRVLDEGGGVRFEGPRAATQPVVPRPLRDAVESALRVELERAGVGIVEAAPGVPELSVRITRCAATLLDGGAAKGETVLEAAFGRDGASSWTDRATGRHESIPVLSPSGDWAPRYAVNGSMGKAVARLVSGFARNGFRALNAGPAASAQASAVPAPRPAAPKSDVDELPAKRAIDPKAVALVIGVERYREALPAADFAAADARLAGEYFKRVFGVSDENLAVLVDDRATKSDFEKHIEQWLPNHVEPGSKVYVYFSGHGAPEPAKGDAYLVPYDADPTYITKTGYSLKRLYDNLGKLPAESVTVAMDSCFSGAGGRSVLAKGARPLVAMKTDVLPAKLTVLSASGAAEISNSYQEKGHGLFTYYFLKGLKEKGNARAAFEYLVPEVSRVARRTYNSDQTPQWREAK
ncbi:MAG: caspase family protein [Elusimicrobiota bacterium]|nr:MAG: caspase family protein [Elusimicrobiota bacterium]